MSTHNKFSWRNKKNIMWIPHLSVNTTPFQINVLSKKLTGFLLDKYTFFDVITHENCVTEIIPMTTQLHVCLHGGTNIFSSCLYYLNSEFSKLGNKRDKMKYCHLNKLNYIILPNIYVIMQEVSHFGSAKLLKFLL